ncbi:hypothetical protein [Lysobacter claricitrinus]|uniref:hypothetical protein n=1 Tax=Lysobacter claricitrinus TaxID=3367728 RepID=UPI0037DAC8CC
MSLRRLLLAILLVGSFPAAAADHYVAIEKRLTPEQVASVGLTPEQLSRLNALLQDADARDAATRPAAAARVTTAADDATPSSPVQFIGLDGEPITAKVHGSVAGWAPGTVFELDNGQQWKVLKGNVTLRRAIDGPTVRLVPGLAGRWFLELDEDHPKARVYRID